MLLPSAAEIHTNGDAYFFQVQVEEAVGLQAVVHIQVATLYCDPVVAVPTFVSSVVAEVYVSKTWTPLAVFVPPILTFEHRISPGAFVVVVVGWKHADGLTWSVGWQSVFFDISSRDAETFAA